MGLWNFKEIAKLMGDKEVVALIYQQMREGAKKELNGKGESEIVTRLP